MEAIAAVASFIAIGQALAAIPKIIEVLRSLVEIRQEIIQLVNEVSHPLAASLELKRPLD